MEQSRGSTFFFSFMGMVWTLLINLTIAYGMVQASKTQRPSLQQQVQSSMPTGIKSFHCYYLEERQAHRIEVQAMDLPSAMAQVCGVDYRGSIIPPVFLKAYAQSFDSAEALESDPILASQRESCSCGHEPQVLQNIDLVVPPKLGQKPEEKKLPRIANRREQTKVNRIDVKKSNQKSTPKPKKKISRKKPTSNPLLHADFDPNRPENSDVQEGSERGSRSGQGIVGKGDPYLQRVKAILDNSLTMPATIPPDQRKHLKARLSILIDSHGYLLQWQWRSKSHNKAFDAMIERTLKRYQVNGNQKFPKPPPQWDRKWIPIRVDGRRMH